MRVDEQQLLDVSRDLWTTVLGLQVDEARAAAAQAAEATLAGRVQLSGAFEGALVLECPVSIARHAAAMLFATDAETASDEEISDALAELAHMVGKRVARLFPEAPKTSRPSVVVEWDPTEALSGMRDLGEARVSCEGRSVRILLYEAEPQVAA